MSICAVQMLHNLLINHVSPISLNPYLLDLGALHQRRSTLNPGQI